MLLAIVTGTKNSVVDLNQISGSHLGSRSWKGKGCLLCPAERNFYVSYLWRVILLLEAIYYNYFLLGLALLSTSFNCMAGGEIDWHWFEYLQRCLIKHMEGIKVEYGMSVRLGRKGFSSFMVRMGLIAQSQGIWTTSASTETTPGFLRDTIHQAV